MSQDKKKSYPCSDRTCEKCPLQVDCAANDWSIYDYRNKKCPNWLDGVKQWHKFLKEEKREEKVRIKCYESIY